MKLVGFIIDALFGLAIWAGNKSDERRARRRLQALGEAMARDEARKARATAKTVVLPRPAPVTSRPEKAPCDSPTAPTRPGRGR